MSTATATDHEDDRTRGDARRTRDVPGALQGAAAGLASAAAGIAASELLAGLVAGVPSLVIAVGTLVIALQPPGAKDLVVRLFGTNDKLALNVGVLVVALLIGAWSGIVARRNFGTVTVVFAAFGMLGFVGAWQAELVPVPAAALSAVAGTLVGLATLRWLTPRPAPAAGGAARRDPGAGRRAAAERPASEGAAASTASTAAVPRPRAMRTEPMPDWGRRRFLLASGGVLASAAVAGTLGRYLLTTRRSPSAGRIAALSPAAQRATPLDASESLQAPGITPIVMPNDRFYRIDTALLVPQVDASTWTLNVHGMVDHPLTFTYDQLAAMPLFEQYVTISCVSNEVGGDLVGNALWKGVRLKDVLASAGVQPAATQIASRSVDGFTAGFPTAWAMDPAREPMIALAMNGVPLPAEHGYPARLIIPGLYGYVSATKWLSEIELTTREAFDGYWIKLGWAKDGPILTQSRIDHPGDGDSFPAGQTWIDGIAWAPDRGVQGVEVAIDGGPWQRAMTSRAISKATWVQWMLQWNATRGSHTIEVRAIDGTGTVQTADRSDPAPSGARGHHRITVQVGG